MLNLIIIIHLVVGIELSVSHWDKRSDAAKRKLFRDWKSQFDVYSNEDLGKESRYQTFLQNCEKINAWNAEDPDVEFGLNAFGAHTEGEFLALMLPNMTLGDVADEPPTLQSAHVKTEVDWVQQGAVSRVGGQGGCGDCYIWSALGAVEGRCQIKHQGPVDRLSVDQVKDSLLRACKGGNMGRVFKHVEQKHGVCLWNDYKLNKNGCTRHDKIISHHVVKPHTESKLQAAVSAGPVSVGIQAVKKLQFYKHGIFSGKCGARLNHAVLAVGFGEDATGKKYWKLKNSWGKHWGEEGFIRLCRDCGKNKGAGQCGIAKMASYPSC